LVSEKTIEENILKKANEKRLLGSVAIEGGNFTTAFFRQVPDNFAFVFHCEVMVLLSVILLLRCYNEGCVAILFLPTG